VRANECHVLLNICTSILYTAFVNSGMYRHQLRVLVRSNKVNVVGGYGLTTNLCLHKVHPPLSVYMIAKCKHLKIRSTGANQCNKCPDGKYVGANGVCSKLGKSWGWDKRMRPLPKLGDSLHPSLSTTKPTPINLS
jgi:hypothetical protein